DPGSARRPPGPTTVAFLLAGSAFGAPHAGPGLKSQRNFERARSAQLRLRADHLSQPSMKTKAEGKGSRAALARQCHRDRGPPISRMRAYAGILRKPPRTLVPRPGIPRAPDAAVHRQNSPGHFLTALPTSISRHLECRPSRPAAGHRLRLSFAV